MEFPNLKEAPSLRSPRHPGGLDT